MGEREGVISNSWSTVPRIIAPMTAAGSTGIPETPLFTVEIADEKIGLRGFLCIHSLGNYGTSGGMRCVPDIERREVELLARAMTYKYAFFKLDQGGAKAGLRVSYDEPPERRRLLIQEAARHLRPLIDRNLWSPHTDMNFYADGLIDFFRGIGHKFQPQDDGGSSFRTAVWAFAALRACIDHLGVKPDRTRVAFEGFGSVAGYMVPFLKELGVKVVALTTHRGGASAPAGVDLDAVLAHQRGGFAWDKPGKPWKPIATDELFDIESDIFIPCARVHSIDADRARRLKTSLILPVANVPCTDEALEVFDERGISYLPDYVVNGGGVCGSVMAGATPENPERVSGPIEVFRAMNLRLLSTSKVVGKPPRKISDEIAHHNYPEIVRHAYDRETILSRISKKARARSLFPGFILQKEIRARRARTLSHLESLFI
ncbi:MAG TPA: Glu/Leu/Phe/Val dehydrogenase dimerization domain-containing protein [Isosphaeraceae bacterium]|nr:Glu/Leu/Phe/Val dehydrogenase dimerization domain-containing protein [Isosphaeraceae bacterium]